MVAELPKLQHTVLSYMPPDRQREAFHVWDIAVEKMGGYIYSRLILAVAQRRFSALVLSFFGVPFAVALGIWVGVLSQFIPVIGTYLAAILPALVALSANGHHNDACGWSCTSSPTSKWRTIYRPPDHQADDGDPSRDIDRGDHHRWGPARRHRDHPRTAHGRDNPGSDLRVLRPIATT